MYNCIRIRYTDYVNCADVFIYLYIMFFDVTRVRINRSTKETITIDMKDEVTIDNQNRIFTKL